MSHAYSWNPAKLGANFKSLSRARGRVYHSLGYLSKPTHWESTSITKGSIVICYPIRVAVILTKVWVIVVQRLLKETYIFTTTIISRVTDLRCLLGIGEIRNGGNMWDFYRTRYRYRSYFSTISRVTSCFMCSINSSIDSNIDEEF